MGYLVRFASTQKDRDAAFTLRKAAGGWRIESARIR